ncbi:MAG: hypothetical protein II625_03370 [Bacilli bacterium]|nr:hypothetical protein [Bacilli bacterium]
MKKVKYLLLLIAFLLIVGCGKKEEEVKNKTPEEVKEIFEKEIDFAAGTNVHQEFINVAELKQHGLNIKWEETPRTVNIRGNMVQGYEVNNNIETYDDGDSYVLGLDGTLYRYHKGNYSIMKTEDKIKRIGTYYVDHGGSNACHGLSQYVIETEKGILYFENNEEGAVAIKKFEDKVYYMMPVCYGVTDSKLNDNVVVYDDGKVLVNDVAIKDKATKEELTAKYVIYAEKENKEKYYLVTTDDKLYIIDEVAESYQSIAKVETKVNPSEGEESDVDIDITYDNVTISMQYVIVRS